MYPQWDIHLWAGQVETEALSEQGYHGTRPFESGVPVEFNHIQSPKTLPVTGHP